MNDEITADFVYIDCRPTRVEFGFWSYDGGIGLQNLVEIYQWLLDNNIVYTVLGYDNTGYLDITVECEQALVLIKLAFTASVRPVRDGAETMSMTNPCSEITI